LYIGTGVVGGTVRSTRETANRLGALAVRILSGTAARDIPIEMAPVAPVVDWREIQRWHLAASRLPPGTQILFREPSAWDRYRGVIVATVLALVGEGVLIGALLVQRRRRKRADAALRRTYARVRDLGSRLLNAQEEERSRIARELHDDISQRIAVLKIDLTILSRSLEGEDAATASRTLARADDIADAVRALSHRLHPSRLHFLGLGPAIAGLTAELAHPGVNIAFTQEGVPATLPHDVTVSLFRVAQEALQNALKYSHARVITLTLKGDDTGVDLRIADDGVGFDVEAAVGGLGLTSIRERVEAHAGTVEIRSAPGAGTLVHVRVPATTLPAGGVPPVP
jgi:signal transduction histidine kinase